MAASFNHELSATHELNTLTKLRTYLHKKPCSCCYDFHPLARARIVNEREMLGYVGHLWTLNEIRWTTEVKVPYYGDESVPHHPLGNIWNDYHFDQPTKTLLDNKKSEEIVRDLKETQRRERCAMCECLGEIKCPKCSGFGSVDCDKCHRKGSIECCHNENCMKCKGKGSYMCDTCSGKVKINCPTCLTRGRIPCTDCKGLRFILVYNQLHVKWENHESSITRDISNSSILPASEIEKASNKVTCLKFDDTWSSTQSIETIVDTCVELPDDLWTNIREQYRKKHCNKEGKIIRLRCTIQCLRIKEIDYTLDKKLDEIYTFCLYGEGETQVYENQYPYKCCGRCTLL